MNQLSFIKIKFDSTKYDFKTINNITFGSCILCPGNYTGMINKTSGLPSGFGRYKYISYTTIFFWDGQFYEGEFHGISRFLTANKYEKYANGIFKDSCTSDCSTWLNYV